MCTSFRLTRKKIERAAVSQTLNKQKHLVSVELINLTRSNHKRKLRRRRIKQTLVLTVSLGPELELVCRWPSKWEKERRRSCLRKKKHCLLCHASECVERGGRLSSFRLRVLASDKLISRRPLCPAASLQKTGIFPKRPTGVPTEVGGLGVGEHNLKQRRHAWSRPRFVTIR